MCVSPCVCVLIFHVKDVFIIVLFQPVLLTVIGVILIAVRLPLDDSAGDLSAIGFFFPPRKLTARRMRKRGREREREKERGGSRREIGLLSVLEQALAFIRSTIWQKGNFDRSEFFPYSSWPPPPPPHHPTSHHWSSPSPLTPPDECRHALLPCFLLFWPHSIRSVFVLAFVWCMSPLSSIILWELNVRFYGKNILFGTVCIPPIFTVISVVLVLTTGLISFREAWALSDDVTSCFTSFSRVLGDGMKV